MFNLLDRRNSVFNALFFRYVAIHSPNSSDDIHSVYVVILFWLFYLFLGSLFFFRLFSFSIVTAYFHFVLINKPCESIYYHQWLRDFRCDPVKSVVVMLLLLLCRSLSFRHTGSEFERYSHQACATPSAFSFGCCLFFFFFVCIIVVVAMHSLCWPIIVYENQKLWKKEEKEEMILASIIKQIKTKQQKQNCAINHYYIKVVQSITKEICDLAAFFLFLSSSLFSNYLNFWGIFLSLSLNHSISC